MNDVELQEFIIKHKREMRHGTSNKLLDAIKFTNSSIKNYRSGKLDKSIDNIILIISSDKPITIFKGGTIPSKNEHKANVIKLLSNMTAGGLNVELNKQGLLLNPSEISKVRPYLISNMITNVSKSLRTLTESIEVMFDGNITRNIRDFDINKSKIHKIDAIFKLSNSKWEDAIDALDQYVKKLKELKDELNTEL